MGAQKGALVFDNLLNTAPIADFSTILVMPAESQSHSSEWLFSFISGGNQRFEKY
ncbi:hypothetical protein B0I18_107287 [Taibaiella chishuiensis]|uniref:Uncharacterized protein n=1 Tax=Taibaiella chishuiensis TaxID=1434707 RepID=A0A2P8D0Y0_9BACT|nr:hypothetical protein B0I18_107287 [Taibaiella chishuiensis]